MPLYRVFQPALSDLYPGAHRIGIEFQRAETPAAAARAFVAAYVDDCFLEPAMATLATDLMGVTSIFEQDRSGAWAVAEMSGVTLDARQRPTRESTKEMTERIVAAFIIPQGKVWDDRR